MGTRNEITIINSIIVHKNYIVDGINVGYFLYHCYKEEKEYLKADF